jgi:hypothetical protein
MEYDSETINVAKMKGVLDSGVDASVLSLDAEEKSDLLRKFNAGRAEGDGAESSAPEEPRGENIYERLEKRDAEKRKASPSPSSGGWDLGEFLQKIINFFYSLFGGAGGKQNFAQKKELKELEKALAAFHISVYDPKLNLVRKAFMEYLEQLHGKVEEFYAFFTRNFKMGPEEYINERAPCFAHFVIEAQFSVDQARLLRELRTFDIPKNLTARGEVVVRREVEYKLSRFIESFSGGTSWRMDEALDLFNSILNLHAYNFVTMFSLFRAADMPDNAFKDFSLEYCTDQMRTLDSYLARIDFSNLREDHYNWFDRFNEAHPGGEGDSHYLSEDFRNLINLLRKLCSRDIVGNLVRIGSEDPKYRAQPVIVFSSWVGDYRQLAESSVKSKLERCIGTFREEQMQIQVNDLFEGYQAFEWNSLINRETNMSLDHAGGPQLVSAFTYNLLWNYMDHVYIDRYKRSVNTIVVEGEFRKKEMAAEFANTYYELDGIYEQMQIMNERVEQHSPLATRLSTFIAGNMENALAIKNFTNELHLLCNDITRISQQCGMGLMTMGRLMDRVVYDFKALHTGELVNARTIGGVSNRNLLAVYDKFVQSLKKLEPILSRFIVVRDHILGAGEGKL